VPDDCVFEPGDRTRVGQVDASNLESGDLFDQRLSERILDQEAVLVSNLK